MNPGRAEYGAIPQALQGVLGANPRRGYLDDPPGEIRPQNGAQRRIWEGE